MDKLITAYETKDGSIGKQMDVLGRDHAYAIVLNLSCENNFHIKDVDFDEDGYLHGYDDDGEQVADFQYIDMEEYEEYMEEYGDEED